MYRVTTPTNTFRLPENATEYAVIQITYKDDDGKASIVKYYKNGTPDPGMSISDKDVAITLTQAETKKFEEGIANAQVRVKTPGGKVMASKYFRVNINDVLNEEEL